MRTPRRVAGLATVTVLALGAAACGTAEAGIGGAAAPTPAQNLVAAAPDATTPAFAFTAKGGCVATFSGIIDAASETAQVTTIVKTPHGTVTMSFLAFGTDGSYARITSKPASLLTRAGIPRSWVRMNPAKLAGAQDGLVTFTERSLDPMGVGALATVASGVVQSGAGQAGAKFTGTVDLTRIVEDESPIASATLSELGEKAKTVPFEAVVDNAGNLTTMKIMPPSAKACTMTYGKYGKARTPSAPKAKKAPDVVYTMLNS
ncbi:hypothetical protein AB0G04_04910 [Actinoplanes sp. NPDC023801]|uniref:hypothetical protein n=1 Tax=Actinoplanes sp. NPDC023801 TaxID=3154595 RepID=UPI0033D9484C